MSRVKRNSSNSYTSSPKKMKRESLEDSDEVEHDHEDEEIEEGVNDTTLVPDEMVEQLNGFAAYLEANSNNHGLLLNVKNLDKLLNKYYLTMKDQKKVTPDPRVNPVYSEVSKDFKRYLRTATRNFNFRLVDAIHLLNGYLGRPEALKDYEDYPRRLPNSMQIYIEKKGMSRAVSGMAEAAKSYKNESAGAVDKIKKELDTLGKTKLEEFEAFLANHPNLSDEQVEFVKKQMKRLSKKVYPPTAPKSRTKKAPAPPKEAVTAFSLYCKSMSHKYTDLDEENRQKKLQKKFSRIGTEQLTLLESIAMNSN